MPKATWITHRTNRPDIANEGHLGANLLAPFKECSPVNWNSFPGRSELVHEAVFLFWQAYRFANKLAPTGSPRSQYTPLLQISRLRHDSVLVEPDGAFDPFSGSVHSLHLHQTRRIVPLTSLAKTLCIARHPHPERNHLHQQSATKLRQFVVDAWRNFVVIPT